MGLGLAGDFVKEQEVSCAECLTSQIPRMADVSGIQIRQCVGNYKSLDIPAWYQCRPGISGIFRKQLTGLPVPGGLNDPEKCEL